MFNRPPQLRIRDLDYRDSALFLLLGSIGALGMFVVTGFAYGVATSQGWIGDGAGSAIPVLIGLVIAWKIFGEWLLDKFRRRTIRRHQPTRQQRRRVPQGGVDAREYDERGRERERSPAFE